MFTSRCSSRLSIHCRPSVHAAAIRLQLVPAVTELVIAQLLYLQWLDPRSPSYVYINSTGTSRADGETVSDGSLGADLDDLVTQRLSGCS